MFLIFFQQFVKTIAFFDEHIKTGDERAKTGDENLSFRQIFQSCSSEMEKIGDKHPMSNDKRSVFFFKCL